MGSNEKKDHDDDFSSAINRMARAILILSDKQALIELSMARMQREIDKLRDMD